MRTFVNFIPRAFCLLGLVALAACEAPDGSTEAPDTALVSSVMRGLGAIDPKEKPIEYTPRGPLAMPAEPLNLPQPETKVAGTKSENWPKAQENPEYAKLKELYAQDSGAFGNRLNPEQMRGFKVTGVTGQDFVQSEETRRQEELLTGGKLTASERKAIEAKIKKLKAEQTGMNQANLGRRQYLTEPPTAYSTPSADAPMPQIVATEESAGQSSSPVPRSPVCAKRKRIIRPANDAPHGRRFLPRRAFQMNKL